MKKLASVDILRFEAVCSYWFKTAKSYISAPYFTLDMPQTPWLMIPGGEENHVHTRRFFNLAEFKYYTIKNAFGDVPDAWYVGSSHGWLVLIEVNGAARHFNPFSGEKIELPSIGKLLPNMTCSYIIKAVTSSKPPPLSSSSSKDFVVIIYYDFLDFYRTKPLAFWKQGDDAWTGFGQKEDYDHDIMFSTLQENWSLTTQNLRHSSVCLVMEFHNACSLKEKDGRLPTIGYKSKLRHLDQMTNNVPTDPLPDTPNAIP